MKKLLLPIIMLLVGVGSGVGAGLFLQSPPEEVDPATDGEVNSDEQVIEEEGPAADDVALLDKEYAKLSNQFVVPIVEEGEVAALVVLSLSLEVPPNGIEAAYSIEPRLRDSFLRVMFDHANVGGFSGNFTNASNMRVLRQELVRSAQHAAGDIVTDVLILDIVRQDM